MLRHIDDSSHVARTLLALLPTPTLHTLLAGAPGLGPLSMRRELIVFKDSYRSRKYCLSECTQVCAIQSNGGCGPVFIQMNKFVQLLMLLPWL